MEVATDKVAADVGENPHAQMEEVEESRFMYEEGTNSSISDSSTSSSSQREEAMTAREEVMTAACTSSLKRKRRSGSYRDVLKKYLEMKLKAEKKTSSMLFLESLREDVEKLSGKGQRTFRLKVQELLNTLLVQEGV